MPNSPRSSGMSVRLVIALFDGSVFKSVQWGGTKKKKKKASYVLPV